MSTLLVVAAHPDDEVLGCGATMARLAHEGWSVHVRICAEGSTSRDPTRDPQLHDERICALRRDAERANAILGAQSVEFSGLPDNRMDSVELLDVVKLVEGDVERVRPSLVLTHHAGDVNVDHGIVHDSVLAAIRPQPGHYVREVLFFEVPSSTEWRPPGSRAPFGPTCFFNVEGFLDRKLAALEAYASEMRAFPHPRSRAAVEHLARWRGATVGCGAAEAFVVGRRIV
jgi:LmbE family N-acetylglucosaminyl deacetylase